MNIAYTIKDKRITSRQERGRDMDLPGIKLHLSYSKSPLKGTTKLQNFSLRSKGFKLYIKHPNV